MNTNLWSCVQVLENCNYAVELGKKLNFVLVGIGGRLEFHGGGILTEMKKRPEEIFLNRQILGT